ncbi:energy transducer TonB [Winogradskyella aquimaris]|uniref:Energy transducer TonB n=1 Tax=Winogradskyella aquimaris TaxID=864074 RepID=A0ABU5EMX1_9FLAO|nr:energy transducer TonB [Winogradskyella aquimaris]MDY2586246.1 energy transducer TonB [Winogradskyella aquimaris]
MKDLQKKIKSAGQSTIEVKKSQKHDANLQKNSTLYFQIGLILCLLATYGLFEMQFQDKKIEVHFNEPQDLVTIDVISDFTVEKTQKKLEPKVVRSKKLTNAVKAVENDEPVLESEIFKPDVSKTSELPLKPDALPDLENPKDKEIFVPFTKIEKVPVYPGCEKKKTNEDKRKCMSQKISRLVSKKFNTDVASEHGITGLQKIQTQFTVDKHGNITDIKIRSPHPVLEKEAKRVIDKIPSMKPGYQQDKPVGVIYNLPIKFMARD